MASSSHDSDNESHTSRLEQQLRRQLLLNHRLDQEQRDLELRLEDAEHQLATYAATGGGESGERRAGVACEDASSCGGRSDVRALEERLAQTERELEAEQADRLQVADQLAVALDELRKQGNTILSLTASLDRAAQQLADADTRLDLTWVQGSEDYQLTTSDLMPLAWRDTSHNDHDNNDSDHDNNDSETESHTARLEQQLRQHIALNRRLDQEQRDLELRLEEAENQLANYAVTGGGRTGGSARMTDRSCSGRSDVRVLEERLVQMERELEVEHADRQQLAKERQRLEEQLSVAHNDLMAAHENTARAETAAFKLSRRLTGALRAQSNSAKLIARLRKS
jgi:hypothetical protein